MDKQNADRQTDTDDEVLRTADGEPLEDRGIPVRHRPADNQKSQGEADLWGNPNPPVEETDDGPAAGADI
jgi:hypothetical protein